MSNNNLVVMVIDNNFDLTIEVGLQQSGYRLITEQNLTQAIEDVADFTSRNRPDLILLDLDQLPVDELWMVNTLRETTQGSGLPIICLGKSKEAVALRTNSTPALNKLVSKSEMKQLATLIDDLLSQRPMAAASSAN